MATQVYKINDIDYECEFTLSNPDNQEIKFKKDAIRSLELVDDFFNPFMVGNISISNPFDIIEQDYFFRGDGRDKLLIKFKPVEDKGFKAEEFEQEFSIIDESNIIDSGSRYNNIKGFSLLTTEAVKFMDVVPYGKVYSGKVGDLIQEVIIDVLGDSYVDGENSDWASGDFELEFYPPATFRYMDVLKYFLRIFYAKDSDIYVKGFLRFNQKLKQFEFKLLSEMFRKNKELGIEAFPIGDLTSEVGFDNENNPPSDDSVATGQYISQLKNLGYSTPQYAWSTEFFTNSTVYGYDPIMGQQKIYRLNFDDVKARWTKNFVDPFKAKGGKPVPFAIKNKLKSKTFRRYNFPYRAEDSVKIVESEIHNALTFYNLQLSFSNLGTSSRKAGRFIDIFSARKPGQDEKTFKNDQKILGRWFVTQVKHVFIGNLYTNQIFATKTYIGPSASLNEETD